MAPTIITNGLFEKVKDRLKASKSYALADGRKESRARLYRKLKGKYYDTEETTSNPERIKVETIAGLTYQQRPVYHFRRPHVSVEANTPKFITEIDGVEKELNNVDNAVMMEIALNQELKTMDVEDEVNAIIQDWICPYEFGALKVGYGNKTLFSSYDTDKVNADGVWVLRTCPDDIFVDWQARGKKSIGYYFHAIHKPLQWIKDNKDFNVKARQAVASEKTPDYLKDRLRNEERASSYDVGCIFEYHDLETGQIAVLSEAGNEWLTDPYDFPYDYKRSQFVFLIPMPLNNDFYGRCYVSLAEPQVDEINSYRTRLVRIFKKWPVVNFFKKGAWSLEQQRKWQDADDSENIEVNDPAGIETRTMPSLPADIWRTQELMERDMEKELGTSSMRRGEVSAVKPTTAQIIEGHGNIRDADVREDVAKIYRTASSKICDLMIQFYDKPRWVKLTGGMRLPSGVTREQVGETAFALYSSSDIRGNYDFSCDVTSMSPVNNELKAKILLESYKGILTSPSDIQQQFMAKYDINGLFYDIVKMQGVDLNRWAKQKEAENQDDPWAENEHVLGGGILMEPSESEKHRYHSEIHGQALRILATNPSDPRFIELARHDQIHKIKLLKQEPPPPQQSVAGGQAGGLPGMSGNETQGGFLGGLGGVAGQLARPLPPTPRTIL